MRGRLLSFIMKMTVFVRKYDSYLKNIVILCFAERKETIE